MAEILSIEQSHGNTDWHTLMGDRIYQYTVGALFLLSPCAIFIIRPDFQYSFFNLIQSLFITLYSLSLYLIISFIRGNKEIARKIDIEPALYLLILPLLIIVILTLAFVDPESVRISRYYLREQRFAILLLNLNIIVSAMSILYYFYRPNFASLFLLCVALFLSMYISLLEGRRAIVVILIGLATVLALRRYRNLASRAVLLTASSVVIVLLMLMVTDVRTGQSFGSTFVLFQSVLTRVFNPGWMMLEVVNSDASAFNPDVLRYLLDRFLYVAGFSQNYVGVGNDFGVHYRFISATNNVVGINPGVILELYLAYGALSPIPVALLLVAGRFLVNAFAEFSQFLPAIVAILLCHGFQMEVGYTFGLMLRLLVVLLALKFLVATLPRGLGRRLARPL